MKNIENLKIYIFIDAKVSRDKIKVSSLANMRLKNLLHMAAMSCLRKGNELYEFYQKKVAEGKAKMAGINALRNKIIHRVFACAEDTDFMNTITLNALHKS